MFKGNIRGSENINKYNKIQLLKVLSQFKVPDIMNITFRIVSQIAILRWGHVIAWNQLYMSSSVFNDAVNCIPVCASEALLGKTVSTITRTNCKYNVSN